MNPEEKFAKVMRELRIRSGYTQEGVAVRLKEFDIDLHFSAISKMESGTRVIRLNEAVAVLTILGGSLIDAIDSPCCNCFGNPPRGFRCNECGSSS